MSFFGSQKNQEVGWGPVSNYKPGGGGISQLSKFKERANSYANGDSSIANQNID